MALNACRTHKLAVIAFVVAIAGIIFPAISILDQILINFLQRQALLTLNIKF
jgi:hypothetical protein